MTGGGPLRSASLLEYLSRSFSVHAVVFHQPSDPDPVSAIPRRLVDKLDVLELPYHSSDSIARLSRNSVRVLRGRPPLVDRFSGFERELSRLLAGHQYDLAVIEHFWCAPYVEQLRPHAKRVIIDLHNIESVWHRRLAGLEHGLRAFALRRFATASVALERKYLPAFDHLLVASSVDVQAAREISPDSKVTIYPNALPEIVAPATPVKKHEIVFSGNLAYAPNIRAVQFFHDQVWPTLRARWPALRWKIAGKNPDAIQGIVHSDARIELTGPFQDAVPVIAEAQVAVVPVLAGSGTRIKILEAWAAGTAVVSTSVGAEGLDARHQDQLLIADTPASFAEAVSSLLASADKREQIASAGRRFYEERFTWPVAWRALEETLGNVPATGTV